MLYLFGVVVSSACAGSAIQAREWILFALYTSVTATISCMFLMQCAD